MMAALGILLAVAAMGAVGFAMIFVAMALTPKAWIVLCLVLFVGLIVFGIGGSSGHDPGPWDSVRGLR